MSITKSNTRMLDGSIPDSQLESGVGTSANNLVKLDANAKLPAVDGSQLTNRPFKDNFYHVVHNTTSDGGTFTSGAWQVRQLNSERSTQTWASVSGDVVTLDAGTYHVEASAPAFRCNSHVTRITVDDVEVLRGTAEYSNNADPTSQTRSFVSGRVTLASQLGLKLEHRCIATQSNNGLGIAHGIGDTVFADVKIYKLS